MSISGTEMNLSLRQIALLPLAFLASAWSANVQSQNNTIGCFEPFQCTGATTVGFTLTTTANECASFCRTISDCNYFTFYDTQGNCLAQRDCPGTDSECSDCISGIFYYQFISLNWHGLLRAIIIKKSSCYIVKITSLYITSLIAKT